MVAVSEVPQFVAGDEVLDEDSNGSCSSLSSNALDEKTLFLPDGMEFQDSGMLSTDFYGPDHPDSVVPSVDGHYGHSSFSSKNERDKLISSINWLKNHVPLCVRKQLGTDKNRLSLSLSCNELPHKSSHESALLFVDVAGFTRLSQILDPEQLSKVRAYFPSPSINCTRRFLSYIIVVSC
jgi:hypothetical protein